MKNRSTAIVGVLTAAVLIVGIATLLRSRGAGVESVELDRLRSEIVGLRSLGVVIEPTPEPGVRVIVLGGPAARAGITSGDVILRIGAREVDDRTLWSAVPATGRIDVTVRGEKRTRVIAVTILQPATCSDDLLRFRADCAANRRLGAVLDQLFFDDDERRRLNIATPTGVKLLTWKLGPAQGAGVRVGDVLVKLDGRDVSERTLAAALDACGERATLTVVRGSETLDIVVPLDGFRTFDDHFADVRASLIGRRWLGAVVQGCVLEPKAGGPAERAGVKAGDEVVSIEGRPVTPSTFAEEFRKIRFGDKADMVVRRGAERRTFAVSFDEFTVASERRAELAALAEYYLGVGFDPVGPALKVAESRAESGFRVGDVFARPATRESLAEALASGSREITVLRDAKELVVTLAPGEFKTFSEKAAEAAGAEAAEVYLGAGIQALKVGTVKRAAANPLKPGDVLLRIAQTDLTASTLGDVLALYAAGESVDLVALRGGERVTLKIVLGDRASTDAEIASLIARANAGLDYGISWPSESAELVPKIFVHPGGAAQIAGLRSGDELVGIASLAELFAKRGAGPVTLRTRRGEFAMTAGRVRTCAEELERMRRDGCARLALGIALEDDGLRLFDVQVGGPAHTAGLREGDEIRSLGGETVTPATFVAALRLLTSGRPVLIEYGRGAERLTAAVTPDGTVAMVGAFEEFCAGLSR